MDIPAFENGKAGSCGFGRLPAIRAFSVPEPSRKGLRHTYFFPVCPILIRTGKGPDRKEKRKEKAAADNGGAEIP